MPLSLTDMQSLVIKGLRLRRQRAQSPAQLRSPLTTKLLPKRKGESLHCLLRLSQKTESKRRRKRIRGALEGKAEEGCKVTWREKKI